MNSKADVNRRVLAIQAKKKRHKPNKKRVKQAVNDVTTTTRSAAGQSSKLNDTATSEDFVAGGATDSANNSYHSDGGTPPGNGKIKLSKSYSSGGPIFDPGRDYETMKSAYHTNSLNASNKHLIDNYMSFLNDSNSADQADVEAEEVDEEEIELEVEVEKPTKQTNKTEHNQYPPPRSSSNDTYESELNSENDEQELKVDYCKGGYHPVNIGDLFQGKHHRK